jgi:hypothetical protein
MVFCEESYNPFPIWFSFIVIIIFNQFNIKKKSTKTILEKIIYIKKTMWGNIIEIHNISKKKNYKAKFLTTSI